MVLRCENQKYNPQELELLAGLRTHIPEIQERNQKQWERLLLSSKAIKIYAGVDMPESTIVEFLAKVCWFLLIRIN